MVAGPQACSCADCGTVCTGRFAGCPVVWAAAPSPVPVPALPLALGTGQSLELPGTTATGTAPARDTATIATNGANGKTPAAMGSPVSSGSADGRVTVVTAALPAVALATPALPGTGTDEVVVIPAPDIDTGPVARASTSKAATSEADGDLRLLCQDLKLEVRRLNRMIENMTEVNRRSDREIVMSQVDARFQWLTDELSDRLVILGNEVMAIRRHLDGSDDLLTDTEMTG